MASVTIIENIGEKQENGTISHVANAGASFSNVIDTRADKGNYTLEQFFDHYMNFMKGADFLCYSSTPPQNDHCRIWIDTDPNGTGR